MKNGLIAKPIRFCKLVASQSATSVRVKRRNNTNSADELIKSSTGEDGRDGWMESIVVVVSWHHHRGHHHQYRHFCKKGGLLSHSLPAYFYCCSSIFSIFSLNASTSIPFAHPHQQPSRSWCIFLGAGMSLRGLILFSSAAGGALSAPATPSPPSSIRIHSFHSHRITYTDGYRSAPLPPSFRLPIISPIFFLKGAGSKCLKYCGDHG